MAIITGQSTGIIQTPELKTSLEAYGRGGSIGYSYFAWTLAEAMDKMNQLKSWGYQTDIEQDGPGFRISCTYNNVSGTGTSPEEPTSQWTLTRNLTEEHLFESDRPDVKMLTTKTKEGITLAIKKPSQNIQYVEDEKQGNAAYMDAANRVYWLMVSKATGRRLITKTLRRTITVDETYNSTWLQDSENKVITTPSMISRYGIPLSVSCLMPQSWQEKLNSSDNASIELFIQWGWLDLGVDRTFTSNGNINISAEWEWGRWPLVSYDVI